MAGDNHRFVETSPCKQKGTGFFITLEGPDGSGKTTQCDLLCDELKSRGVEVVRLREPGGTPIGESIRSLLLRSEDDALCPLCELMLYEAARAQLVHEVIIPAVSRGAYVVSDRFCDSTTAYQGMGRELGMDAVRSINELVCQGYMPDRTIVLDIDESVALERATKTGADRMERAGIELQRRVRQGYAEIALSDAGRVRMIDASGSVDTVQKRLLHELEDILPDSESPCTVSAVDHV